MIAVLLGEPTEKQRLADARALLDQGFASLGADAPAANAVQRANARPGEHRAQARARML
ncbi:D-alanyl-D-alanine carboxypeptidase family domain protein [Burkholderia pseudomallei TSV 31]|nr:D-alanyl-D-alanine carboxypeptidase family domain protein [Burkholderia pseudomallei TSV 43]KGV34125.1 D-alanyl-D-alanine carboxypeptidase family domain protein [Burkholderia pseudomallei TSV 31]